MRGSKILLADIETSLMKVEVPTFGLFNNNPTFSHKHITKDWYIISISWKWLGQSKINVVSVLDDPKRFKRNPEDDTHVLKVFREVLEKADVVVGHNFKRFDTKKINARFIIKGLAPIAPVVVYDTLTVAKSVAAFTSNRLDYLAQALGYKGKISSEGLHQKIYKSNGKDVKAIKAMAKYNKNDVDILEFVYNRLKPYGPALRALSADSEESCGKCGSHNLVRNGTKMYAGGRHQIYRCNTCGGINKGEKLK